MVAVTGDCLDFGGLVAVAETDADVDADAEAGIDFVTGAEAEHAAPESWNTMCWLLDRSTAYNQSHENKQQAIIVSIASVSTKNFASFCNSHRARLRELSRTNRGQVASISSNHHQCRPQLETSSGFLNDCQ